MDKSQHVGTGNGQQIRPAISTATQLVAAFASNDVVKGMCKGIDSINYERNETFLLIAFTEILIAKAFRDVLDLWLKLTFVPLLPEL